MKPYVTHADLEVFGSRPVGFGKIQAEGPLPVSEKKMWPDAAT